MHCTWTLSQAWLAWGSSTECNGGTNERTGHRPSTCKRADSSRAPPYMVSANYRQRDVNRESPGGESRDAPATGECRSGLCARLSRVFGIRGGRGRYRGKAPPVVLSPTWYHFIILPRLAMMLAWCIKLDDIDYALHKQIVSRQVTEAHLLVSRPKCP